MAKISFFVVYKLSKKYMKLFFKKAHNLIKTDQTEPKVKAKYIFETLKGIMRSKVNALCLHNVKKYIKLYACSFWQYWDPIQLLNTLVYEILQNQNLAKKTLIFFKCNFNLKSGITTVLNMLYSVNIYCAEMLLWQIELIKFTELTIKPHLRYVCKNKGYRCRCLFLGPG